MNKVIKEYEIDGFRIRICLTDLGYLTAYVGVELTDEVLAIEADELIVHGGVTFMGSLDDSNVYYIGFDAAHGGDAIDSALIEKELSNDTVIDINKLISITGNLGTIRTVRYMEEESLNLLAQIRALLKGEEL